MAFGAISTVYIPTAANAGSSLWGTDVRKLLSAVDAAIDTTTRTNHGTGGSVVRTCDPYTLLNTDSDQTLFGWAIAPTDMNSVSGALRALPAGNHTTTIRFSQSASTAASTTLTCFVYRVGDNAGGRVRTLLGSGSSTFTPLTSGAQSTQTVAVSLPAITFGVDETIQYAYEITCAGVAVTGRTCTFTTGQQGGVDIKVDLPGVLQTITTTAGSSAGTSTVTGADGAVIGAAGSGAGTSTVTGLDAGVGTTTGSAGGTSTDTGQMIGLLTTTGSAAGTSVVSGQMSLAGETTGTATGSSVVTGAMSSVVAAAGTAAGTSTVAGATGSVAATRGSAAGTSAVDGFAGIVLAMEGQVVVCASGDWPVVTPTKAIEGTVFDHETGDPIAGATVYLVRDVDGAQVAHTLTDVSGAYSFVRDESDPYSYHTYVQWLSGTTQIHGVSDRGCVPV